MSYDKYDLGYEEVKGVDSNLSAGSILLPAVLAILKRPWLSIGSIFLVMIPIIFYLYSQVPKYKSESIVSIARSVENSFMNSAGIKSVNQSDESSDFYYYILKSNAFHTSIVKRVLEVYPHLPADSIATIVKHSVSHYSKDPDASFLYIRAVSEIPEFAQFLAEQAIVSLQELSLRIRRSDAKLVSDFIDTQLFELNNKLSYKEAETQEFLHVRQLTIDDVTSGPGGELRNLERKLSISETNRDLAKLQIDTYNRQIEQRLNQYLNRNNDLNRNRIYKLRVALEKLNDQLNNTMIDTTAQYDSLAFHLLQNERKQVLSELFTLMHMNPIETNKQSRNKISIEKLESELDEALIVYKQSVISAEYHEFAIKRYLDEHPNLPQDILEYLTLFRAKEVLQKTIDILIGENESIRIEIAAESGGVKIIDEPRIPREPIPQNRGKKLGASFVIALVVGFGLAYVIDLLDNTIQGEMDIISKFNLPVFGSVPVLNLRSYRMKKRHQLPENISNGGNGQVNITLLNQHSESSPVAEAYRSIRTALLFNAEERKQKVFVISSAIAGEGKSLTTFNLGLSFAQGGLKTLIVDGDLRRASLHKLSNLQRSPGITDYLLGKLTLKDIVIENVEENMSLISAGSKVNNPADLLSSVKMKQFVDEVSSQYDVILFDSPPVTPCMDSRNLANIVGGMIYIVRAEMTKMNIFEHSVSLIRRVNVDLLGVIVNYASFRYGYGYYYLYHRYHSYGYYSGGYHYYYYSYYQETETGDTIKRKHKKKKTSETETTA